VWSPAPHQLKIQLFDASGQQLWQEEWDVIAGENRRMVSAQWKSWPTGAYFLSLADENGQKQILSLLRQ